MSMPRHGAMEFTGGHPDLLTRSSGEKAPPAAASGLRQPMVSHVRHAGPGVRDKVVATAMAPTTWATPSARVSPGRSRNHAIIGAHGPNSHLAQCSTGNNVVRTPSPIFSMITVSAIRTSTRASSGMRNTCSASLRVGILGPSAERSPYLSRGLVSVRRGRRPSASFHELIEQDETPGVHGVDVHREEFSRGPCRVRIPCRGPEGVPGAAEG